MALSSEVLGIRFGYGLPLPKGIETDPAAIAQALKGPDTAASQWSLPGTAAFAAMADRLQELRQKAKAGADNKADYDAAVAAISDLVQRAQRSGFARALDTNQPFRERLITFFANHFTANARGGASGLYLPYALVEEAIRPHIGGSFADMVQAVTFHPGMLIYLDQQVSVGPNSPLGKRQGKGLNENYARELMELHTLGVDGGYSQNDVRQLAELLTGLSVDRNMTVQFERKRVEPGPETIMGKTYDGDKVDAVTSVLRDLALHPATAKHIAQKLAVHFVSDSPDAALVEALRATFAATDGDIPNLVLALLSHASAAAGPAEKIRQPFDFVVSSMRALGVDGAQVMQMKDGDFKRGLTRALEEMGQRMKYAPGPDGWPEEAAAWVTPPRLAARIDWAMSMPQRLRKDLPDPVAFAKSALGAQASATLLTAASRAESARDGVGIVLSSPEFNRR